MRKILARSGLRFEDDDVEARFLRSFVLDDIGRLRVTMLLGMGIYYGFSAWDRIIDAEAWQITHLVRAGVVAFALLPLFLLTFSAWGQRHLETLILLYSSIPSIALSAIYARLTDGFSHGAAGIVIVILFVTALLRTRLLFFCGFGAATWIAFAVSEALSGSNRPGLEIVNNLYVGTAVALGVVSVLARERLARRQFQASSDLAAAKDTADRAFHELQATRARLLQSEKLESLGQLVTGIAHEINTPIGNALTTVTTLGQEAGRLAQAVEPGRLLRSDLTRAASVMVGGAKLVHANLDRAAELIQTFKQIASVEPGGERRSLDIGLWLNDFAARLNLSPDRPRYELRIEAAPDLMLDSYPAVLSDIVVRLVDNSVVHAFGDRVGVLTLAARRITAGGVRIVVGDDGRGIAAEHLPKLFDPFFTLDRGRGGAGLGLHIVHNQVMSLGGTIAVESEVGSGTRFAIDLPEQPPS